MRIKSVYIPPVVETVEVVAEAGMAQSPGGAVSADAGQYTREEW